MSTKIRIKLNTMVTEKGSSYIIYWDVTNELFTQKSKSHAAHVHIEI